MNFGKLLGLVCTLCVSGSAPLWASTDAPPPAATAFAYSISHAVTPLPEAVIDRVADPLDVWMAFGDTGSFDLPSERPQDQRLGPPRVVSQGGVCSAIAAVARAYKLPIPFFANLIWQESSFKLNEISRAGAQGIAQFMPKTAVDFGLINPFEPIHALNVSARFLRELKAQFGNLGLAAAAYNAGPRRVIDWMGNRGALPRETQNYVLRITGHLAERWAAPDATSDPEMALMPAKAPCREVAEAVEKQAKLVRVAKLIIEMARAADSPTPKAAEAVAPDKTEAKAAYAKAEQAKTAMSVAKTQSRHTDGRKSGSAAATDIAKQAARVAAEKTKKSADTSSGKPAIKTAVKNSVKTDAKTARNKIARNKTATHKTVETATPVIVRAQVAATRTDMADYR